MTGQARCREHVLAWEIGHRSAIVLGSSGRRSVPRCRDSVIGRGWVIDRRPDLETDPGLATVPIVLVIGPGSVIGPDSFRESGIDLGSATGLDVPATDLGLVIDPVFALVIGLASMTVATGSTIDSPGGPVNCLLTADRVLVDRDGTIGIADIIAITTTGIMAFGIDRGSRADVGVIGGTGIPSWQALV